jgi:hypothetical protein
MAATNQNDAMLAGDRRVLRFLGTNTDEDPPVALDFSTFVEVRFTASPIDPSGAPQLEAVIQKTSTDPTEIDFEDGALAEPNQWARVHLYRADTIDYQSTVFYCELEVLDGAGEKVTVATGLLTVGRNLPWPA